MLSPDTGGAMTGGMSQRLVYSPVPGRMWRRTAHRVSVGRGGCNTLPPSLSKLPVAISPLVHNHS